MSMSAQVHIIALFLPRAPTHQDHIRANVVLDMTVMVSKPLLAALAVLTLMSAQHFLLVTQMQHARIQGDHFLVRAKPALLAMGSKLPLVVLDVPILMSVP